MPRKSELSGILRRGSACLSCRRRKLRCDGTRPVCHQCSSMRRESECAYDNSRKSRTQTLREKLFALEAKVRELEHGPGQSQVPLPDSTALAAFGTASDDGYTHPVGISMSQLDPMYPMLPQSWSLFHYGFDGQNEVSSASSSSHSNMSMPMPLDISIPFFISGQPAVSTMAFTDSSGTPVPDGPADRFLNEPSAALTVEMHNILIQTFIEHRKQCCFYSNTSRFDPSSSATVYQSTPPNSALMSAIYLLGSFFARIPVLEKQLLDQSLHEVARSLHNQEQLMDGVQALCLLAQYFFFSDRAMEGTIHLTRAKRIALDFGLNQVSYSELSFDLDYPFDSASYGSPEKAAIFWQVFMVEKFWSASNDCCQALPDLDSPCQHITTPLPVLEGAEIEFIAGNSPIHALFESGDTFRGFSLSISAFKAMAACIFDHSVLVHNTSTSAKDSAIWSYHRSAGFALERLSAIVPPFAWRDSQILEDSLIDTDLYTVHSLILASTIHLHLDNIMNLKISWAAKKVVELVNHLSDDDYNFLDPVLSICWSSIVTIFRRMIENAKEKSNMNGASISTTSYAVAFLNHCVGVLLNALQNLSSYVPLADTLLKGLEDKASVYPCPTKILPSFGEGGYMVDQSFVT